MTVEELYQWAKERGLEGETLYFENCCGNRWVAEDYLETTTFGLKLA